MTTQTVTSLPGVENAGGFSSGTYQDRGGTAVKTVPPQIIEVVITLGTLVFNDQFDFIAVAFEFRSIHSVSARR